MLVLDGNIPRFPWEPSTTMLTYRLQGTTEQAASHRGGPNDPRADRPIFARHGEPKGFCVADLQLGGGAGRDRTCDRGIMSPLL